MSFESDYAAAKPYEALALQMLDEVTEWGACQGPEYVKGTHPPDVIINSPFGDKTVDVKHDISSERTGNIFVEAKSLYADYLCYFIDLDGSILFIKVQDFKAWMASKPSGVRYVGCAGDAKKWNGNHGGYIIPVSSIKKNCFWLVPSGGKWQDEYRKLYMAGIK